VARLGQDLDPEAGDVAGEAEEAIAFDGSVLSDSEIGGIVGYGADGQPDREGTVRFASFALDGESFAAMDSARVHAAGFNEAISIMVRREDHDEVDRYWDALSAVPGAEQCGCSRTRYGLSWQIVPTAVGEMLASGTDERIRRVTTAFLSMKKFDVAALQRVRRHASSDGRLTDDDAAHLSPGWNLVTRRLWRWLRPGAADPIGDHIGVEEGKPARRTA